MSETGEIRKDVIYEKVVNLLREVLNLKPEDAEITGETRFFEDLGAESLDIAQFVMSLEDEFQKSIKDEQLADLKSVQDAVDQIHNQLTEPDE